MFIQHFNMKFFQLQQDLNKQILCHLLQSMYVVMSFRNLIYLSFLSLCLKKKLCVILDSLEYTMGHWNYFSILHNDTSIRQSN